MWRSVASGVVLVGLLAGCSWAGGEAQARISRHVLEAKIRQVEGVAVRCSRHKADGSRWACVVPTGWIQSVTSWMWTMGGGGAMRIGPLFVGSRRLARERN